MSNFYEDTMLREEYKLVKKLQESEAIKRYVEIRYLERGIGTERAISENPNGKYPEQYVVHYRMPVYTGVGQLRSDFHAVVNITLSKDVLSNRNAANVPYVTYRGSFAPFNNHVTQTSICIGNAWTVAKDNGLWHLIISLGALINQDEFVCAEGNHYNSAAYNYWVQRGRKPVTYIKWPVDLLESKFEVKTKEVIEPERSAIKIIAKSSQVPVEPKKMQIHLKGTKDISEPKSNFKIIKKD